VIFLFQQHQINIIRAGYKRNTMIEISVVSQSNDRCDHCKRKEETANMKITIEFNWIVLTTETCNQ